MKIRPRVILFAVVMVATASNGKSGWKATNASRQHPAFMGLLSFFQRHSGPESIEAPQPSTPSALRTKRDEALWRSGVFESYPLGEHIQAAYRPGETPRIFPAFALEFLADCKEFQPLGQHVRDYAEKHGWDSLQVQALEKLLPELQRAGLLVSAPEVVARLTAHSPEDAPSPIRSIGFPTGGNRVHFLERAIRSFAENLRQHGRSVDFLVSDSSVKPEHAAAFRECAAALRSELGFPILYAGPEEKHRFIAALVEAGACAPESAEFALLDPLGTGFACGANRNALLLHGAGEMLCSVDDDVVCRIATPRGEESGLGCASNGDPFSRWLFADRESAWNAANWQDRNFVDGYEQMLGRSLGELFRAVPAELCDFSGTGEAFLRRVDPNAGRVRATFFGHIGDPGIPTSVYYLYFDGENRRRLTASEEHYRSVFGSRSVHTLVPRPTIGDSSVSPGMAMGLDHRTLLPPFIPVLHAEDFAWGAALWKCCGDAFLGHVPLAIQHDPGPGKSILLPSDFTADRRVVLFEWAHLLRRLTLNFDPAESLGAAERMRALGREFLDLSQLPERDFATKLASVVLAHESGKLSWLERQLHEDHETPEFWREDVQAHLDHVREALSHDDFDIPLDLKPGRTPSEARRFMQTLLGRYGQLLQDWPAMVAAAAELKRNGRGLFSSL